MKPIRLSFFAPLLVALLAGCGDPANQVHKSAANDPKAAAPSSPAAGKEYVIRAGSTIGFTGSKVTGSHHGGFKNFAGNFHIADGKLAGTPELKIAMQSTWADNEKLAGHLKSSDFFDVEKFPITTFTVTSVAPEGAQHKVTGNLNLHGVTKSISFPATVQLAPDAVTLKAEFAINRRDFNINFPGMPNDLIRDNVVLNLDIKATPGPAKPEDQLAL
ncbi:MAG TPA: YceI family protein [Verrucomicrobiota bacterium]|nr:YceI family protein [Verrucomicrobiales bacterium]HRI16426.1 YceI family protein [Verrucomicrobiota bacterium]